jgi:hypothetical protein
MDTFRVQNTTTRFDLYYDDLVRQGRILKAHVDTLGTDDDRSFRASLINAFIQSPVATNRYGNGNKTDSAQDDFATYLDYDPDTASNYVDDVHPDGVPRIDGYAKVLSIMYPYTGHHKSAFTHSIAEENANSRGGSTIGGAGGSWTSTGRKVTLKDGSKRSLYKNPSKPGDLRIRRMAKHRNGRTVATYVKPR